MIWNAVGYIHATYPSADPVGNSLTAGLHSSWLDGTALTPLFRPLLFADS
jgi:hypothetical protein